MSLKQHWHSALLAIVCALMGVGQILAFSIATKGVDNALLVVYLSCIPAVLWLGLSYCLARQNNFVPHFTFATIASQILWQPVVPYIIRKLWGLQTGEFDYELIVRQQIRNTTLVDLSLYIVLAAYAAWDFKRAQRVKSQA